MKRINKTIVSGVLLIIIGLIATIGIIITTKDNFLASVNPMNLKASDVPYTNNSQSTLQGAIDNLYTKANTYVNPDDIYFDLATAKANSTGKLFAIKKGICISRSKTVYCFKINNWDVEKDHIQQVFSEVSCSVDSSTVNCSASDFRCRVYSDGYVSCTDKSDSSYCSVFSVGSVTCD